MLQTGLTPLHLAAQEDRVNAAEVLAKHDANLDQQTKVQHTHTHTQQLTNVYTNTLKGVHRQKLVSNHVISWTFKTRNLPRTSWNYTRWLIKGNPLYYVAYSVCIHCRRCCLPAVFCVCECECEEPPNQ